MVIGIILISCSIVIRGLQMTISEKIFKQYDITALQMVGWQGILGFTLWSALMAIISLVGCPFP